MTRREYFSLTFIAAVAEEHDLFVCDAHCQGRGPEECLRGLTGRTYRETADAGRRH